MGEQDFETDHKKVNKQKRDVRFFFISVLSFLLLFCSFLSWWAYYNSPSDALAASLHSVKEADYQPRERLPVAEIDIGILADILRDLQIGEEEIQARVDSLSQVLLTPVPLSTGTISAPSVQRPNDAGQPPSTAVAVVSPGATQIAVLSEIPTQTISTPAAPTPAPIITPAAFFVASPQPTEPSPELSPQIKLVSSVESYDDLDSSMSVTFNDRLRFQIRVTNTGDAPLNQIQGKDDSFGGTVTCPAQRLTAGKSMTCTVDLPHTVSLNEANQGYATFVFSVSGTYNGKVYRKQQTLKIAVAQNPAIQVVKGLASYGDKDGSGTITQGDWLWYQFQASNIGDVSLSEIGVVDATYSIAVSCPKSVLTPDESMMCQADSYYLVTADDVSAGSVANSAVVSAKFMDMAYTDDDTFSTLVEETALAVISGQVRRDLDGDGDLADVDPGLQNVRIELKNSTCSVGVDCAVVFTDALGRFEFADVPDGAYQIMESDPSGYVSSGESDLVVDNVIDVVIVAGASSTGHQFLDAASVTGCSDPDPVTGFVVGSIPADNAVGVPLSISTITITYNQPMSVSLGHSVTKIQQYLLANLSTNKQIDITDAIYDSGSNNLVLTFDNTSPDWISMSQYELRIKQVENFCGTSQTDVFVRFTTE